MVSIIIIIIIIFVGIIIIIIPSRHKFILRNTKKRTHLL